MKKFTFKSVMLAALAMSLSSCNSYFYQVYTVDSKLQQNENSLVFENEDCKVLYNLWGNNGNVKFAIQNKTDKDIFINMGQTFFVLNGMAKEYFQGRTYTNQNYSEATYGYGAMSARANGTGMWGANSYVENLDAMFDSKHTKFVNANLTGTTTKEKEIVCIPARCFKMFCYYKVYPTWIKTCDKSKDFPKDSYVVGTYEKESSPLLLNNRIAYGFTKNDVADRHIDNEFWVSNICNFSRKTATEKVEVKDDCGNVEKYMHTRRFKIGGPNMFYKVVRTDGRNETYGNE